MLISGSATLPVLALVKSQLPLCAPRVITNLTMGALTKQTLQLLMNTVVMTDGKGVPFSVALPDRPKPES